MTREQCRSRNPGTPPLQCERTARHEGTHRAETGQTPTDEHTAAVITWHDNR